MSAKRVLIVANKWWEADPLCGVLIHNKARPAALTNFRYLRYPAPRAIPTKCEPRIVFDCADATVELWCLEELMNPAVSSSSSLEKARVLPGAFAYGEPPALVIAFGTAGSREGVCVNGSVVIGRRVFIHDPMAGQTGRTDLWKVPCPDQLIESPFPAGKLVNFDEQARYAAEARFLKCPVTPAEPPLACVGNGFTSLGVVNIKNYDDYVWADSEAIAAFKDAKTGTQIGSVETTHGIIRSASEAPFLYVSGITDTEGLFDYQVAPRVYAQNFVAAHNAAIALAWLLPSMVV